ncbi:MAG TPA: hypothetical protein VEK79_02705 [Thermoanaerobaculia bacterium]|nr:hypothetical protein [Thermoanaerobaculia bacterium]
MRITIIDRGMRLRDGLRERLRRAAGLVCAEHGNPHVVRCDWCHQTRTLFRDECESPFQLSGHGWRCDPCNTNVASQAIRF